MKKTFLIIIIIFIHLSIFSQNFRLGIEYGLSRSLFSISNAENFLKPTIIDFLPKNINITVTYTLKNNIFMKSGIGYYKYSELILEREILYNYYWYGATGKYLYKSISIPLQVGYKLKIFSNFYLKYASGIEFDFLFDFFYNDYFINDIDMIKLREEEMLQTHGIYHRCIYGRNSYKRKFNILLSQQLSLSYEIKKRVYIDFFAEYHAGLFKIVDMTRLIKTLQNDNTINEYNPVITSNGSYWKIGLGVGYIFKNKNKK